MVSIPANREFPLLFYLFFMLIFFFHSSPAATPITFTSPECTRASSPSSSDSMKILNVKLAVADIIINAKANLGIWGIFIGINPDSIPPEKIFQQEYLSIESRRVNLREVINFEEGLIITLTKYKQKGVPKVIKPSEYNLKDNILEPVGSFFKNIFGKKKQVNNESKQDESNADNVQTALDVFVQAVDLRKEEMIGSFWLNITHTGGNQSESFKSVLKKLEKKATVELKILFQLSSEVTFLPRNRGKISLNGKYVYPNMLFEIIEPDRVQQEGHETYIIPGKRAGIAAVTDTLATHSLIKIIRKWEPSSPGFWAVEYPYPVFAFQINYHPPSSYSYQRLDFQINATPLKNYDFGGGFHLLKIKDNRNDEVNGLGFFGFMLWRMYYSSRFTFGGKLGLDLDIPMRTDDDGNEVNLLVPSISPSFNAEILISERVDLVMNLGYRLAKSASRWEYTVDDETLPAYWSSSNPRIDNSGLFLSLGFRFIIY